jgi:hypothetical protein
MPECASFTLTKSNPYFLKRRKYTLNLTVTDKNIKGTSRQQSLSKCENVGLK